MKIQENAGLELYSHDDEMTKKLQRVASFLTAMSPRGFRYYVDDTYLDYGQDWEWTTVLADTGSSTYQALSPKEQERVFYADSINELHRIAEDVLAHAYVDKIK